jgi:3-methyladenine DNA glycosylase AlkD
MINPFHSEILQLIKKNSGKGTTHTFLDSYLGNDHPRYEITAPVLRRLAQDWMRANREMSAKDFSKLLTSLIEGVSSTEKWFAGMLLDYSTKEQRTFDPALFDKWLDHLVGWAEVDAVCTGDYTVTHIVSQLDQWKKLLTAFSKDENIHKRRASLVLLCAPVRYFDDRKLAEVAFKNIDRLKSEKSNLITKAISWLLRSMIKLHQAAVVTYLEENKESLPKIAVRETRVKLKTGTKTKRKVKK